MKPCIPLSPFEIDSTHHIHHSTITNDSVILTCQPLVFDDRFLCLTGSYVYIETSAPRKLGDKAWLLGPEITAYQTICLSFWYNMNGESAATLSVYMSSNGTLPGTQLWKRTGNKGIEWLEGRVPLMTSSLSKYKVRRYTDCVLR
ncbi:hypothetical protein DPMN_188053 [Dreissena polymorpha]|uniref:MAM domain-containing protein n=1 Tax=Dreissena polymorpha TaxID=45954 RepID=A0A9D4IB00_DREPO|nr:hypothetical protein DPMN_188053 [Dreissena polymorpha]